MKISICFGQFGPYHHARVSALQLLLGQLTPTLQLGSLSTCIPVQIAGRTTTYDWDQKFKPNDSHLKETRCLGMRTLCGGVEENVSPLQVFFKARQFFRDERVDVAFLPSYSPARYFALFAAAKSLGLRTVMMNESHAGTERATGLMKWLKCQLVRQFDAALVGGQPQRRHFAALGMPAAKIFTGYDAVNNDFFISRTDELRILGSKGANRYFNEVYALPNRYFLSLGRMVEKKNLSLLIAAYFKYCLSLQSTGAERETLPQISLVFVGSGPLERCLMDQALSLGLCVIDRRNLSSFQDTKSTTPVDEAVGHVYFYGFRQIQENAIFYAYADAFILPSIKEEWGLVVNEAMASALPVIVSRDVGCAEDLLRDNDREVWFSSHNSSIDLEQRSNGFVFDSTSVDALASALALIAELPQMSKEMGKQSRQIIENFSCENFASQALRATAAACDLCV